MITKKELCWLIVNEHRLMEGASLNELNILTSSTLAVAMEYLGLLKDDAQSYASERAGTVFVGDTFPLTDPYPENVNVKHLSFRELLSLLPD